MTTIINLYSTEYLSLIIISLLMISCNGKGADTTENRISSSKIVSQVLNNEVNSEQRHALFEKNADMSVDILQGLVHNLETNTEEEARRIPWIWEVTIAAGGRNESEEIRQLLEVSLPEMDASLLNWQAVVLGGGIINGISREGSWPRERINGILKGHKTLQTRWKRAVELSFDMAKDTSVAYPWRYDALRMIAMDSWERSLPELKAYLAPGLDDHLHMGAISGLSDIRHPNVSEAILNGLPHISEQNLELALDAMLRTEERVEVLLNAIAEGIVDVEDLGEERIEKLKNHENRDLRNLAVQIISP